MKIKQTAYVKGKWCCVVFLSKKNGKKNTSPKNPRSQTTRRQALFPTRLYGLNSEQRKNCFQMCHVLALSWKALAKHKDGEVVAFPGISGGDIHVKLLAGPCKPSQKNGNDNISHHSRESLKIIDSKVVAGMGYVRCQEGK